MSMYAVVHPCNRSKWMWMYWQTYALFPVHRAPSESMLLCGAFWMSLALPSSILFSLPLRWSPSTMCPSRRHTVLSGHWGMLLMKVYIALVHEHTRGYAHTCMRVYAQTHSHMHSYLCSHTLIHTTTTTHTYTCRYVHTLTYTPSLSGQHLFPACMQMK